jgi:hypothetical protein
LCKKGAGNANSVAVCACRDCATEDALSGRPPEDFEPAMVGLRYIQDKRWPDGGQT